MMGKSFLPEWVYGRQPQRSNLRNLEAPLPALLAIVIFTTTTMAAMIKIAPTTEHTAMMTVCLDTSPSCPASDSVVDGGAVVCDVEDPLVGVVAPAKSKVGDNDRRL